MTAATSITIGTWQGFLGRGLAERELQCVLGVAQGKSSKELGRDLGIAADSVKKRLSAAMFKLQVNRRAALVGEAIRRGLIAISITPPALPGPQQPTSEHDGIFVA